MSEKHWNKFCENLKYEGDGVRKLIKSFNSVPYREHNVKYANQGLHIYIQGTMEPLKSQLSSLKQHFFVLHLKHSQNSQLSETRDKGVGKAKPQDLLFCFLQIIERRLMISASYQSIRPVLIVLISWKKRFVLTPTCRGAARARSQWVDG